MQLTYRGITYTPANSTVEMADTGLMATFRGAAYSLKQSASLKLRPLPPLTYRGVAYGGGSQVASPAAGGVLNPSFS
jgi:hypothetical protein